MKRVIHSKKVNSLTDRKSPLKTSTSTLHTVCYVKWRDAFTETDEWHSAESMTAHDYICETVGFVVENNSKKNYISIAGTITVEGMYASIINIPKAMVITKKIINII